MRNLSERNWVEFKVRFQTNGSLNLNQSVFFEHIVIDGNEDVVFHFVGDSEAADAERVEFLQAALVSSREVQVHDVASQRGSLE
jgi:hypothetical protein